MLKRRSMTINKIVSPKQKAQFEYATVIEDSSSETVDVNIAGKIWRNVPLTGSAKKGQSIQVKFERGRPFAYGRGGGSDTGTQLVLNNGAIYESPPGDYAPTPHDAFGIHHAWPSTAARQFAVSTASLGGMTLRAIELADLPSNLMTFANPTAQVGLTAINGSALTAMRSDAAPALNVGITPTWTGAHIHNASVQINNTLGATGAVTFGSTLALTGAATLSNTLTVAGATALNNTLNVTGATTILAPTIIRNTSTQLKLEYGVGNGVDFVIDSGGSLNLNILGDFKIDAAGGDVHPKFNYDLNLGLLNYKWLSLHAAELVVETLVAQNTIATIGGRIIVAPTTQLTRDLDGASGGYNVITRRGTATNASASGGSGYAVITQRGTATNASSAGGGGSGSVTTVGSLTKGETDTASSVTVNKPTGVVDNDVMIAMVAWWTGTLTPPAGWTQIGTTESWAASSDTAKMAMYYKVASSEGSSYTWTNSSSPNEIYVSIRAYTGVNTSTPIDASSQTSTTTQGTSVVGNTITTTVANGMLLFFGSRMNAGANSNAITPDGAMTELTEMFAGSGWTRAFVDEQTLGATGATGSRTATSTGSYTYGAFMVALKAAAGSNTSVTVTKPSGVVDGDYMSAFVVKEGAGTLTVPGGWTQRYSQAITNGTIYYYDKTASSEGSNYTWSLNNTSGLSVHMIAHYNLDGTTKIDIGGTQSNSAGTSMISPSVTTVTAETMLMHFGGAIDTSAGSSTVTAPGGMTEKSDAGAGNVLGYIATAIQSATGATGTRTSTISTSESNGGITVALRPAASSSSSVTVNKPSGIVNTDVMIAVVAYASGTLTTPSSWTNIFTTVGTNGTVAAYYKVAGGSEPADYTWSINTSGSLSVATVGFYNVNTSTPINISGSQANNTASTTMTAPSVTTTIPETMLLYLGGIADPSGGSTTVLPPGGMTEDSDAGAGTVTTYIAEEIVSSTGATGSRAATISASMRTIAGLVALTPTSAGAGSTIYVKYNNIVNGDIVYMEADGKVEWMQATSTYTLQGAGDYSYTVNRNLDGTGANNWLAGDAVVNTGQSNTSGLIDLYSYSSFVQRRFAYIFNYNAGTTTYSANKANETLWNPYGDNAGNGINDAIYFGATSTFGAVSTFVVNAGSVGTATFAWEYWNGSAWTAFTPTNPTGLFSAGKQHVTWSVAALTGWATTTVNGVSGYFVRHRLTNTPGTAITPPQTKEIAREQRAYGPTIAGYKRGSSTFSDLQLRWAIGNLNGHYDYSNNDRYGFAAGSFATSWISVDDVSGIRMMYGTTKKLEITPTGEINIFGNDRTIEPLFNSSLDNDYNGNGFADGWSAYNNGAVDVSTSAMQTTGQFHGKAFGRYTFATTSSTAGVIYEGTVFGLGKFAWRPNTSYILSFYAKAPSGNFLGRTFALAWNTAPTSVTYLSNPPLTTSWQRYYAKINWGATVEATGRFYVNFNPSLVSTVGPSSIDFDAFQVESVSPAEILPSDYKEIPDYSYQNAPNNTSGMFINANGIEIWRASVLRYKLDAATPYMSLGSPAPTGFLTGTGFYVGDNGSGVYRLQVGAASGGTLTEGISWNGSNLEILSSTGVLKLNQLGLRFKVPIITAGTYPNEIAIGWDEAFAANPAMRIVGVRYDLPSAAGNIRQIIVDSQAPGSTSDDVAKITLSASHSSGLARIAMEAGSGYGAIEITGFASISGGLDIGGGLNIGSATGAATGDVRLQSRLEFTVADADGGTYGIIGLNAGSTKNFEVYDYFNSRPMMRLFGSDRKVDFFGPINGTNSYVAAGRRTNAQSVTSGSWATIVCDTDVIDNYNMTDGTSWTAPVDGMYLITAKISWASNSTGLRHIGVYHVASTTYAAQEVGTAVSGNVHHQTISAMIYLTASQAVQIHGKQTSGGSLNCGGTGSEDQIRVQFAKIN